MTSLHNCASSMQTIAVHYSYFRPPPNDCAHFFRSRRTYTVYTVATVLILSSSVKHCSYHRWRDNAWLNRHGVAFYMHVWVQWAKPARLMLQATKGMVTISHNYSTDLSKQLSCGLHLSRLHHETTTFIHVYSARDNCIHYLKPDRVTQSLSGRITARTRSEQWCLIIPLPLDICILHTKPVSVLLYPDYGN
jgi:hypothetical protein